MIKLYTPKELYYKVLYELFKDDIEKLNHDPEFQREFGKLENTTIYQSLYEFQKKGVLNLIQMIQNFGGAILADAVGLGKTWSALATMKFFQMQGYEVILLCPKKLHLNWSQYQRGKDSKFRDDNLNFVIRFHTDLQDNRLENYHDGHTFNNFFHSERPKLIVIDESNNLRNDKSSRYQFLLKEFIQKNQKVKVLLLSATPINNSLLDIRNQFQLIAKGTDQVGYIDSFEEMFKSLPPNLCAYQPSFYLPQKKDVKVTEDEKQRDRFLVKMMYMLIMKRFESSWFSVYKTLKSILEYHNIVMDRILDFEKHKKDVNLSYSDEQFDFDFSEEEDEATSVFIIGKKRQIKISDIDKAGKLKAYKEDLKKDIQSLEHLVINLKKFESILESFAPFTKLFMEKEWNDFSFDENLSMQENYTIWGKWILDTNPRYKSILEQPIDILIATDVLSEGQNLQDCDMVVNYDIHWNPVRVLQRFGRIDRLGSSNSVIHCINFWPSKDINEYLSLQKRVEDKMIVMKLLGSELPKDFTEQLKARFRLSLFRFFK